MQGRGGRQMQPESFTTHIENAHNQRDNQEIWMRKFFIPEGFKIRVEKAIRHSKRNKEVGSNRLHIEMF